MTSPHTRSDETLNRLQGIIREAGAMIRAEFHRGDGPRRRGASALIDLEVERVLRRRLLDLCPGGWLGEETGVAKGPGDHLWVVDPHDGTHDFLSGHRGSSISVALLCEGEPILSVVYAPLYPDDDGDMISWRRGAPIRRNGRPIEVDPQAAEGVLAMSLEARERAAEDGRYLEGMRIRALPSPAYRLALAAAGEVEAGVSLTSALSAWDLAAGAALLAASGRTLVDLQGRRIGPCEGADGCIGAAPALAERLIHVLGSASAGRRRRSESVRTGPFAADARRLDRAQGCLLGQLAGDALGSMVEFMSASEILRRHPSGVRRLADGGVWSLIAGQPTDDSEMALALARSLSDQGAWDRAQVSAAYLRWRTSGPFDVGSTTARGLAALAGKGSPDEHSQSNGALMRVRPIGVFAHADPGLAADLAAEDARLTHPHPVCQAANRAFAAAIAVGVSGADAREMFEAALAVAGDGEGAETVRRRLRASRRDAPADLGASMGWTPPALQNAFHQLLRGVSLEEALVDTVGMGGDTDTNGAICGALIGALQGRESIPLQWRNRILTCRPVRAPNVIHPRPREYWPDDALELAGDLLTARMRGGGGAPAVREPGALGSGERSGRGMDKAGPGVSRRSDGLSGQTKEG